MICAVKSADVTDSSAVYYGALFCLSSHHLFTSEGADQRCLEVRLLLALRSSMFAEGCVCLHIKEGDRTEVCVRRKRVSRTNPSSVFNEVFKHLCSNSDMIGAALCTLCCSLKKALASLPTAIHSSPSFETELRDQRLSLALYHCI